MFEIEDINTKTKQLQSLADSSLVAIESLKAISLPTYDNFVSPLMDIAQTIHEVFTIPFHIDAVNNSTHTDKLCKTALDILTAYDNKISQDEKLFDIFKSIDTKALNEAQNMVISKQIRGYKLSGCGLDEKTKNHIADINLQLEQHSHNFSSNIIKHISEYEIVLDDDKYIKDMPHSDKALAKTNDGWRFTLQAPSYIAFMTYCSSDTRRQELYKAYVTKAPQNAAIIDKILKLKEKKAKLLCFDSFATYSLQTKMAKSPGDVVEFLDSLSLRAKPKAQKELEQIQEFARDFDGKKEINIWDMAYYSDKLKKHKHNIDEEAYRVYFEQGIVIDGFFTFARDMFDIKFEKVAQKLWHDKATRYDITKDEKKIATIYFDLESRADKRSGAWMNNLHSKQQHKTPSAFVVCNFPPSTAKTPSLLRHSDVVTLFHEMGHALHHLLSQVIEPSVSGVNGVAWDVVEYPSQFLESFCYDFETIKKFAKHYRTGKPIPKDMIDRLISAKNFQTALSTQRQVEFAMFDMKLHMNLYQKSEIQKLLDDVRDDTSVLQTPDYNKFQNSFDHIFGGGYSAGYYSYKWAQVLSADSFKRCAIDKTQKQQKQYMTRYLHSVLALGGSVDMNEIYLKLNGEQPDINSLLELEGIL